MDTNFYNNGYGYPYPPQYPYGSYEAGSGYEKCLAPPECIELDN